jgi:hypothetical protein
MILSCLTPLLTPTGTEPMNRNDDDDDDYVLRMKNRVYLVLRVTILCDVTHFAHFRKMCCCKMGKTSIVDMCSCNGI